MRLSTTLSAAPFRRSIVSVETAEATLAAPRGTAAEFEPATPVIRFDGVSKTFAPRRDSPAVTALAGIDLAIPRGSIVGVIGRSGAGKSTLIRLVNGLERPTSGRVVVDGTDLAAADEQTLRGVRRSIGMIFQHFNLLSSRTAFGNVALPLEIAGWPRERIAPRVEHLLDLVGLADKRNRYPAELSGGQKQRVGIARALATSPKVLLSDEATSALDPETTQSILKLLSDINAELGVTILLITHEIHVIKEICREVAVLEGGRIVEHGAAFDVLAAPRHPTTAALVAPVTGVAVPEALARRLRAEPVAGGRAVLRVRLTGGGAGEPVIGRLAASLGGALNIEAGRVDFVGGAPLAFFILTISSEAEALAEAASLFSRHGVRSEVLGHVA